MSDCRLYVGNLPHDVTERELDDLFYKYGKLRDIALPKSGKDGPSFAFVEYYDYRDAEDAIRRRDGYTFAGKRLRVEVAGRGARGGRDGDRDGDRGGDRGRDRGRDRDGDRGRDRDRERKPKRELSLKRSDFGIIVENLPKSSWQDLKDLFAVDAKLSVVWTNVNGTDGEVEFSSKEDVDAAISKYDNYSWENKAKAPDQPSTISVRARPSKDEGVPASTATAGQESETKGSGEGEGGDDSSRRDRSRSRDRE